MILSEEEVLEALTDVTEQIIKTVRNALESTPPELAADIVDHGIVLAGGGSLLSGLDELLRNQVGLPSHPPPATRHVKTMQIEQPRAVGHRKNCTN